MEEQTTPTPPPAPETPSPAPRAGLGRWLSLLLIIGGLILLGIGGWLYFWQVQELAHPPAPIVTVAMVAETATATPAPTKTATVAAKSPTDPPAKPAPTDLPTPAASPAVAASPAADAEALTMSDNPLVSSGMAGNEPADGGSPLTRIVASSINMDASVIPVGWETIIQNTEEVTVWSVAAFAAGWHNNSLLPGQGGNVVLSGHHNVDGEVFRYIVDLEPGATVTLYDEAGETFNYVVEDKFIVKDKDEPDAVRQANARWIGPFNDERLTLVTCWPYTNNTHRVIVIAKPTDGSQAMSQ